MAGLNPMDYTTAAISMLYFPKPVPGAAVLAIGWLLQPREKGGACLLGSVMMYLSYYT